ncbi:hypothetical protein [Bacteroides sp.]|uniref:hypothetical protein n=1 Tax=Bacteroides sp. TaxID=29523 RepID=UPI0026254098|nr:hypothetical protein [Bacteroides sp.]MDD3039094.1 hypothetical protein [Bacteroides sp.]
MSYTNNPAADWNTHIADLDNYADLCISICEGAPYFDGPCPFVEDPETDCILLESENDTKIWTHCARFREVARIRDKQIKEENDGYYQYYCESLFDNTCFGSINFQFKFQNACPHNNTCILRDTKNLKKMINHCPRIKEIAKIHNIKLEEKNKEL